MNDSPRKLTPSQKQLKYLLINKHKKFSHKGRLGKDGSFYYTDKRLSEEMEVCEKTIQRARKALVREGWIRIEPGRYKSSATRYWLLPKQDKMSTFEGQKKDDKIDGT